MDARKPSSSVTVNGGAQSLEGCDPNLTLLELLRQRGLTGTKEGCAEGECGACAVAVVRRLDRSSNESRYEAVNSCLVLAAQMAGQEVWTAEGFARPDGELHPVQQAMVERGGSQCGYCTPGFVVSLFAELYRRDRDGFEPESIAGNLCRCTGYRPIREAAEAMPDPAPDDPFLTRLSQPAPDVVPVSVVARGRRFHRPTTLAGLLELLGERPSARLVAGGTDLVVEMNQNHVRHETLVAVDAVDELHIIERRDDAIEIGAAVPLSRVEDELGEELPLFAELLPLFSSRLIRNRATLGGNLVNASPIGDSPPVLLALDARVRLASGDGEREVALTDFFTGYRQTMLAPGEIVRSIIVPLPLATHARFYKVSKRELDDISTVAAAFAVSVADGVIDKVRLAYGGVAATPARATAAEAALLGKPWDAAVVDVVRSELSNAFTPMTDHRGSAAYRTAMVTRLFEKFVAESFA